MDIIGNALDDICLLEAEIGGQGVLDMLIRNECWQEERLLLRKFLDRVESQRLKKQKGISKKNDDDLPSNLPPWSGEWRTAREQLVTDDVKWVERARTGGLPVEVETGRWKHIPREHRKCECGAKMGSAMHAIEHCPLFDNERRKTKIRLRELGLRDDNMWHLISKAGGEMKTWANAVEKKRAVLTEVNAFIARIIEKKGKTTSSEPGGKFHQKATLEGEEGRELMKTALAARFPKVREKGKSFPVANPAVAEETAVEERVLHQEINIEELSSILQSPKGWAARDINIVQGLINAASEGILSVVYSRKYAGLWYARGTAQLQNCKKEVRAKALKGKGFGLDVCASYPSLLTGITAEIVKKRAAGCSVEEIRKMAQDTKTWRKEVADQLWITATKVKKGVNAILFGKNSKDWRRSEGIPDSIRSAKLERLEKEIKHARVLIVEDEVRNGRASQGDKPTKILSRAVERIEEELMAMIISHLGGQGWSTTSLIHDEITIQHSVKFLNQNEELQFLTTAAKLSLRNFEDFRGWPSGSLQIDIQRL